MKIRLICVSTIVALGTTGCATQGGESGNANAGAAAGAAIGATGGFLACRLTGRSTKDCLAVAALGAVVGGTIGWQKGKEKDLAEVNAMNASFQKVGVPASVDTAIVAGKDQKGKPVTVESFKGITVPLDPVAPEIKAGNPDIVRAMQNLGALSVTRNEPTRIIYRVGPANGPKVREWVNEGISQGKIANAKAIDPVVQELPYERGKAEFIRVEAKDQTQFASTQRTVVAVR